MSLFLVQDDLIRTLVTDGHSKRERRSQILRNSLERKFARYRKGGGGGEGEHSHSVTKKEI